MNNLLQVKHFDRKVKLFKAKSSYIIFKQYDLWHTILEKNRLTKNRI